MTIYAGWLITHDVMSIVAAATIETEFNSKSPPPPVAVTVPSITAPLPEFNALKYPAVPVASALASCVIALAVALPAAHVPKAVALNGNVPSNVPVAAESTPGLAPVRISIEPVFNKSVNAVPAAFLAAIVISIIHP
jgi:hypothetical protein